MLGHELRNPLAPIRTAAALLKKIGPPDPGVQRVRDVIDRQVTHMTRLIDDLLDVSRIARGKITLRKDQFDLAEVVRAAIEDHRALFEANGVTLTFEAPPDTLPVYGDSARVAQIASNLLVNANKFTNRGGRATVEIRSEGDHDVVLLVRDTGIGMDADTLRSIFRPFTQADRSIARSGGGLGLGLALVKGLTELHGGSVSASSDGIVRHHTATAGLEEDETNPPVRRILVVEDNLDAAEMLRTLLELNGNVVAVAHNGADALTTARAHKPEVVICDIGLPGGMDGYAVARALRSDAALRQCYLIAMTGYGQEDDKARATQAGFDCHLTKPVDPALLEQVLDR
jgi:CheY-like chemotaxis protein